MKIDLTCPAELSSLFFNEETQTAELELYNLSNQSITSMKYTLISIGEDNEIIKETTAELEGITFAPQTTFKTVVASEKAETYEVVFTEISFSDETIYTPQSEMTEISFEKAEGEELSRIKRAGAEDGVCYSKEEKDYWLCVCSKANLPASENCIRCTRAKEDVLKDFANEESVALAILNKEDNDAKTIEEEKTANKDKIMKTLKKSGIIAVIIIAVLIIGFFAFKMITTSIGDSALKKGDHEKAYSMYKLAGSDKANTIYDNSSVILGGYDLLAQDTDNIYFSNAKYICKQNKKTGKITVLKEDLANSLSVCGDWIYYIAYPEQTICKLSKDGKTSKCVYDEPAIMLLCDSDDVYFVKNMAQAPDESIKSQYPLYVLKSGEKEAKLVLDTNISTFSIIDGNLYYVDINDDTNLKVMNLEDKKPKTLIKAPVYKFVIKNNKIYYTDSSEDDLSALSLEMADLKGTHLETLIDYDMVVDFTISDNTIYYQGYNRNDVIFEKEYGKAPSIHANSVALPNFGYDNIAYISEDDEYFLTNADKSGYNLIVVPEDVSSKSSSKETPEPTESASEESAQEPVTEENIPSQTEEPAQEPAA